MSASPAPLQAVGQPLPADRLALLSRLVDGLDGAGLWWISGYAAGLASASHGTARPVAVPVTAGVAGERLTVVYGSQTGNARRAAEALASQAGAAGLEVRLLRADAYPLRELKDERFLAVAISTQGDGDPPDDARGFLEFIDGRRAPRLEQLRYAVLGLGDSSYPKFCEIGRRLDTRLAELGAVRAAERGDADLDVETVATPWTARTLEAARALLKVAPVAANVTPLRPQAAAGGWSREHPFAAEVLVNQRITGRGSDRDVRHLELSLEGSGLQYEPGDALGVWPTNPPRLVEAVLDALRLDGAQPVAVGDATRPLHDWLAGHRELTRLSRPWLQRHAERAGAPELLALLEPARQDELARLFATRQPIDVLRAHPAEWNAEALVAALRPLVPRLYSIASSAEAVGEEAHLTVAHVEYVLDGETHWGTASNHLARAAEGERIPVFIERNERFRLPTDGSRDIVMIGPGTGVAPFRGFVQARAAAGAHGRNWLLFGNPHARSDFLYQTEWQQALQRGQLHRLDLAFSRDQPGKVYVQHRLREHGRQLYDWLEGGAHLYVCGDATRMAGDVHTALLEVVATHGGHDAEGAAAYLDALQAQGRYARDVY